MADHTMTLDSAISMRNEELSNRSGSSDGSLNKRGIKSNVALQNKHLQMRTALGKFLYTHFFTFIKSLVKFKFQNLKIQS